MNTTDAAQTQSLTLLDFGLTPWLVLLLCVVPLCGLVLLVRVYPTLRLAALLLLVIAAAIPSFLLGSAMWSVTTPLLVVVSLGIALFAVVDLLTLPGRMKLTAERKVARVASIGSPHTTTLTIENRSWRSLDILIAEDASDGLIVDPPNHRLLLGSDKRAVVQQTVTANRRGAYELRNAYVDIFSRVGLWRRQCVLPCESELHVYPDIKQIGEYALLARTNRLSQIGVRRTRKAGQDNDFERLRDYQQDDNYRHIDWRSTARRQKMTVRQFQTDQSQRVIFLLDCGRMMTNEYQQRSLLDYALNAVLMLSYVALDQGDSVGMLAFSDRVHTYVPPASGKRQMNRMLHAGFNQFPQLVQSRFDEAFLYLSEHCRRRSLVVLVSNVIDEVNSRQIENYMQNLVGAHLPLLVLLRDHRIFDAADNPTPDREVLFRSAAASQLLLWRHQVIRSVEARGSLTLDVFPEKLTAAMVNQYLSIKARHLL